MSNIIRTREDEKIRAVIKQEISLRKMKLYLLLKKDWLRRLSKMNLKILIKIKSYQIKKKMIYNICRTNREDWSRTSIYC